MQNNFYVRTQDELDSLPSDFDHDIYIDCGSTELVVPYFEYCGVTAING